MAAPQEVTIHNLSGQWFFNKSMSDDMNALMELQGVPWLVRKAAAMMSVTARLTQTTDAATGTSSIQIETTATGGFKGEDKTYKLDGSEMRTENKFGVSHVRAQWLNLSESDQPRSMSPEGGPLDPYLAEDWIEEPCEKLEGKPGFVQVYVVQEGGEGTAEQVFGFCMIDGKRYHVQKTVATKDNKTVKVRAVYEWKGQ
ncbi:hypothetical protein PG984_002424 [Apiospora sp. TS-2023a]